MAFSTESFVSDCLSALAADKPQQKITALLQTAVQDPEALLAEFGSPQLGGIRPLHVSDELTIINVVWAPHMMIRPHNHNTWAVIGVYAGREDNIFWRQLKSEGSNQLEAAGARSIAAGEVAALGRKLIHSVCNPADTCTAAIHIYGGNFFEIERSEWDPEQLTEQPYNVARNMASFETENAIMNFRNRQHQSAD